MSVLSLFNIGLTGLESSNQLLQVTGNNVANAQTPGYEVEQANLSTVPSAAVGATGTAGNGVQITNVTRAYNSFINAQVNTENSNVAYWTNYNTAITQVQSIFNEASSAGISSAITTYFNDWQNVEQSPQDNAQRTTLISDANNLSTSLNTAATSLNSVSGQLLTSSQTLTTQVNTLTSQIATLNGELAGNAGSLDLQDQRDALLQKLNGIVKVSSYQDPASGEYSVLLGGTPLVEGSTSYNMSVSTDQSNHMNFSVDLAPNAAAVPPIGSAGNPYVTSFITGGQLAANIDLRDTEIPGYMDQLNAFTVDLAATTNYYQKQGYGLDGSPGSNLFTSPSQLAKYTSVDSVNGVYTSPADTFTSGGKLTIKLGDNDTSPVTVTINPNSTLQDVVNDINNSQAGSKVAAAVVNIGTSANPDYRISIKSNPDGNLGDVRIGVSNDAGDAAGSGLNLLATSPILSSGSPGAAGAVISSMKVADQSATVADAQYMIDYNYSGGPGATNGYQEEGTTGRYWRVMESTDGGSTWTAVPSNDVNLTTDTTGLSRTLEFQGIQVQIDGSGISSATNPNGETFDVQLDPNAAEDIKTAVTDPKQVAASADTWNIDSSNNSVVFNVNGAVPSITAVIPSGIYTNDPGQPDDISAALESAIKTAYQNSTGSALPDTLNVAYNPNTKQFNITMPSGGDTINLMWSNSASTAKQIFGFSGDNNTLVSAAASAVSDNPASVYSTAQKGAPGDNRNAATIAGLVNGTELAGTTPTDMYMSLVSNVGVNASAANTNLQYHSTLATELTQQQQQLSGVSMDQEASNLVVYQKSYEAAAELITTAKALLTTLLQMVNPNA